MKYRISNPLLTAIVCCTPMLVQADPDLSTLPTPAEMSRLPVVCSVKMGHDQAAQKMWEERLGTQIYLHVHHHCYALNFMNRANLTIEKRSKKYYLKEAIDNFNYVLRNWPEASPLHAEAQRLKEQCEMMQRLP